MIQIMKDAAISPLLLLYVSLTLINLRVRFTIYNYQPSFHIFLNNFLQAESSYYALIILIFLIFKINIT